MSVHMGLNVLQTYVELIGKCVTILSRSLLNWFESGDIRLVNLSVARGVQIKICFIDFSLKEYVKIEAKRVAIQILPLVTA